MFRKVGYALSLPCLFFIFLFLRFILLVHSKFNWSSNLDKVQIYVLESRESHIEKSSSGRFQVTH